MIATIPLKIPSYRQPIARDARLVKAAVRHQDLVYTGWRHSDQHGVFYGRYQAARIALRARQIAGIPPMLTSDDLWDDDGTPREVGKPYNPVGDRQAAIDRAAEWRDRNRR